MIGKWLLQSVAWIGGFALLLFVPAGTLHWPGAWVFLAFMVASGLGFGTWLAKESPELLAERMRSPIQPDQPAADKKIIWAFGFASLIWLIVMGLDQRFHGSQMPLAWQALGLALLILSSLFIAWVFRENAFAAAVVKVQSERGHHVISSGPYGFVRHPMYSGAVLFLVGIALLLGSWWGVAMTPIFAVIFAVRTGIEEETLMTGLPGYADYAARVRYRLVPGVW
ncbi:MAG TPA: isoprenylcysteine carboxylmethyltransferase family protein [Bradyrhizobium sp.]|uniref:methyltransferase family protein n=1 Tax=Bradyrhizobium sp. TaxID=376 RepID=UPI002D7F1E40|nr:isoprenylcysteine carboxylmethyltransferase family protein [Bradyrhizobium sp.]HET7886635.1 isoprenylcysteine carboxylmethyltransferase family protein [Bradyrhizobium sp.]